MSVGLHEKIKRLIPLLAMEFCLSEENKVIVRSFAERHGVSNSTFANYLARSDAFDGTSGDGTKYIGGSSDYKTIEKEILKGKEIYCNHTKKYRASKSKKQNTETISDNDEYKMFLRIDKRLSRLEYMLTRICEELEIKTGV